MKSFEPCSKCFISWHQKRIRLCHCLGFASHTRVLLTWISCLTLSLRWLMLTRVLLTPHPYKGPLPFECSNPQLPFECSNPQSSSCSSYLKPCSWLNFRRGHVFDFNAVLLSKQIWPRTWLLNFWAATGVPSLLNESFGTEPGNLTHWEAICRLAQVERATSAIRASSNTSL